MYHKQAYHSHCKPHHRRAFRSFGERPGMSGWKEHFMTNFSNPPANVREMDNKYELHLFAPGYQKSDFIIALIDQKLTITVKKEDLDPDNSWRRLEFLPRDFVREFELNEKIDVGAISAKYENGVLILNLPKQEGYETQRKEITIE
jgi:HSP20 family protein